MRVEAAAAARLSPDPDHAHQSPLFRRSSNAGSSTPPVSASRRVASFSSSQPAVTAAPRELGVGLGIADGAGLLLDDTDVDWSGQNATSSAVADEGQTTSSSSPSVLSPSRLHSPDVSQTLTWCTTALGPAPRSPRSSTLLDPATAARRGSLSGHVSQSSVGSSSSVQSTLSIRMDHADAASAAMSRASSSGNHWLPSSEKAPMDEKTQQPRLEKRFRSHIPISAWRFLPQPLLGTFLAFSTPTLSDSSSPQQKRSLPARLLGLSYVAFSLFFVTSKLLTPYAPTTAPPRIMQRIEPAETSLKGPIPRNWGIRAKMGDDDFSPLSSFHHPYRFSKMHSKIRSDAYEGVLPCGRSQAVVTACIYTNDMWLSELPDFTRMWNGPISAVFETIHERDSPAFAGSIAALGALRDKEALIKQYVDFHIASTPPASEAARNRTIQRMLVTPVASNFHLNVARFFSRTPAVWLVGDARVLPNSALRKRLNNNALLNQILRRADAIVVPLFAALRTDTRLSRIDGMVVRPRGAQTYAQAAQQLVAAHRDTLPLPPDRWPKKKAALIEMSSTHPSQSVTTTGGISPPGPVFALWDQAWDPNRGPSNWPLWRRTGSDARLLDSPDIGGGAGLGVDGTVGGGSELFKVADYDLHYAPAVVIGREQQPWCTERFGATRAACIYQMYLSGAEMWVVPDEWAFTLEPIEKDKEATPLTADPAQKLQESIASRLYTKYHQEACMHYGREFLSLSQWESTRADHLRATCARVLSSWGVGGVPSGP